MPHLMTIKTPQTFTWDFKIDLLMSSTFLLTSPTVQLFAFWTYQSFWSGTSRGWLGHSIGEGLWMMRVYSNLILYTL